MTRLIKTAKNTILGVIILFARLNLFIIPINSDIIDKNKIKQGMYKLFPIFFPIFHHPYYNHK